MAKPTPEEPGPEARGAAKKKVPERSALLAIGDRVVLAITVVCAELDVVIPKLVGPVVHKLPLARLLECRIG